MSLGTRIKERREQLNLTRPQLAEMIGVTPSAIGNYETEVSSPKVELLYKLFGALQCDANYLYQDEMRNFYTPSTRNPTPEEYDVISKYRELDNHGRTVVDFVLQEEHKRCTVPVKSYTYFHKIAAAGAGFYWDDIPTDTIQAPVVDGADFIVGVNGDSMQPTFYDGDMVYVHRTSFLSVGDIGIFLSQGECYIKELGEDGLISHNPTYPIMKGTSYMTALGKVLGKVEM